MASASIALTATLFTTSLLTRSPAALEFTAWYATRSLTALAVVLAIDAYGAYASLVRHTHARDSRQRVALRT